MKPLPLFFIFIVVITTTARLCAQSPTKPSGFSRQDSLRGSINKERSWWDVLHYEIHVRPDYISRTIKGKNRITYYDSGGHTMQLDLQQPMQLDSVTGNEGTISFQRDGNLYHLYIRDSLKRYKIKPGPRTLTAYFSGKPREAVNPPWDGGWIWDKDEKGNPWISVACQSLGASVWYPCKDHQSDEPDSATLSITVPDSLSAVGNGKLRSQQKNNDGTHTFTWVVQNPINNYNIVPYIGKYQQFQEDYRGEKGMLNLSYWVLEYNMEKALKHMQADVNHLLHCYEYWFGPYPFYEDGYKIVEAPHLGMEHQSAIAYGNHFQKGYAGKDWSGTGWGLKWDFLIIHESGHEWFGNNITSRDIADMWIHESFTNYAETIFTQCMYGNEAGNDYVRGTRKVIQNDKPIIGPYGVNRQGSGDMYWKGANMIHTIRQIINNDTLFRSILRGLNKTFYHQTVSTRQIENYISNRSGRDFSPVFDQYLRDTSIPVLEYKIDKNAISFRWTNCVPDFNMPVKVNLGKEQWLKPGTSWQKIRTRKGYDGKTFIPDRNFYITSRKITE